MGLQLFVRRAADVVIVDLAGIATMGPANDSLDSQSKHTKVSPATCIHFSFAYSAFAAMRTASFQSVRKS